MLITQAKNDYFLICYSIVTDFMTKMENNPQSQLSHAQYLTQKPVGWSYTIKKPGSIAGLLFYCIGNIYISNPIFTPSLVAITRLNLFLRSGMATEESTSSVNAYINKARASFLGIPLCCI